MKVITAILLLCLSSSYAQPCRCKKAKKSETTCWGWIKGHLEVDGGTVKEIRGRIVDASESPYADALIEVYDHPELDLDARKRVAACRTGAKGEFCIRNLRPGKYELRGSCVSGFDAGHTIVNLAQKERSASKGEILVTLNVSQ